MAVFSNLEGTMKRSFILGKNGARLEASASQLRVTNYQDTALLPISAGNPVDDTHLVTLSYLKSSQGQGGNNLSGTGEPAANVGVNGDVYYQVDGTNVLKIFFKDGNIWKPFLGGGGPVTDSAYTTSVTTTPNDYAPVFGGYQTSIPASRHDRGNDIIVQLQGDLGDVLGATVHVDSYGDVKVMTKQIPSAAIDVIFIGRTTMTTPFSKLINKGMWNVSGGKATMVIPQSEHEQVANALFITVYENTVDGSVSASPYSLVTLETAIASNGDITLTSLSPFSGKAVISGR